MKANHNYVEAKIEYENAVVNISSSKNESKSQLFAFAVLSRRAVVNISSSKNESKSQPRQTLSKNLLAVVNISSSKNESKSQLLRAYSLLVFRYIILPNFYK